MSDELPGHREERLEMEAIQRAREARRAEAEELGIPWDQPAYKYNEAKARVLAARAKDPVRERMVSDAEFAADQKRKAEAIQLPRRIPSLYQSRHPSTIQDRH